MGVAQPAVDGVCELVHVRHVKHLAGIVSGDEAWSAALRDDVEPVEPIVARAAHHVIAREAQHDAAAERSRHVSAARQTVRRVHEPLVQLAAITTEAERRG